MGKLLLGLGLAAGSVATAMALSDRGFDRLRGWLGARSGGLNDNPLEELERIGATVQSRADDVLDRASRALEAEVEEAKLA